MTLLADNVTWTLPGYTPTAATAPPAPVAAFSSATRVFVGSVEVPVQTVSADGQSLRCVPLVLYSVISVCADAKHLGFVRILIVYFMWLIVLQLRHSALKYVLIYYYCMCVLMLLLQLRHSAIRHCMRREP